MRTMLRRPKLRLAFAALAMLTLLPASLRASAHPGNVFVSGEAVRITIPAAWKRWRAIDIDGKEIGHGSGTTADLGKLPIGYFELYPSDGTAMRITAAVVAKNEPVADTPIAIDAAMSWFYPAAQQVRDACTLCKLLGVNWVRDRASWPELEPARGKWAGETRYERTMRIEHEMGLKILQVNHIAPAWASKDPKKFPRDLRDVYNFYRGLIKRWKGKVDAMEPWNEPDISMFGGQTGCEIASFQKAAYLGFKAGDPDFAVNEAVFAIDRAQTLDEFGANDVWPYFDRYDLHHYVHLDEYARAYGRHRAVSGGRPMWTSEFNLPVWWSDAKTHEPSDHDLRVQGYRVGKVFSEALFQGPQKLFYFMFGDEVEGQIQYGIVHTDLTPRPAYVAFAAVGRFLNGAKPIGKVDFGTAKLMGYLFTTVVDGQPHETLVAWSETYPTAIDIPRCQAMYDYLGRPLEHPGKVTLSPATVYLILPPGGSRGLKIQPPPPKTKWRGDKACDIVLQLIGSGDVKQSAFHLDKSQTLQLVAYNFGQTPAHGKLILEGGSLDDDNIVINPGDRQERTVKVSGPGHVAARLDLGDRGSAIVSASVILPPATTQP